MRTLAALGAPFLLLASTVAAAQPAPSTHEQHQATGQHQQGMKQQMAKSTEMSCMEMMHDMHRMMTEMHKMHQGMHAHEGHDATKPQQQKQ